MDIPNNHYYHPMGVKKGYMKMIHSKNKKDKSIINKISFTKEKITGRAGLSLFSKYFKNIGIFIKLLNYFKKLKRNSKGFEVEDIFFQLFCRWD
jgi:hypothetical protein